MVKLVNNICLWILEQYRLQQYSESRFYGQLKLQTFQNLSLRFNLVRNQIQRMTSFGFNMPNFNLGNQYFMKQKDYSKLKHYNSNKSAEEQKNINEAIQKLSDENVVRIEKLNIPCTHQNKRMLTILLHGIPPMEQQFQQFIFPGKVIKYFPPGLHPQKSNESNWEDIIQMTNELIVNQIDAIVQQHGGKVIFVYHSFGTYIVSIYAHYHPHKIVGLVQFGAIPVTLNGSLKVLIDPLIGMTKSQIINETNKMYQGRPLEYRTVMLSLFLVVVPNLGHIFQWRRQLPKILKLISFGRRDKSIDPFLLNQMAYFYCRQQKLNELHQCQLKQSYRQLTNDSCDKSLQQKFIFNIAKTGHGVHLIRKQFLQSAMNLYFALILSKVEQQSHL